MGLVQTVVRRHLAAYIPSVVRQRSRVGVDVLRDGTRDPERLAVDGELVRLAHRALLCLQPQERDLLRRIYIEEEAETEIRAELGLTEKRFRLTKSRAKLRFGSLVRAAAGCPRPRYGRCWISASAMATHHISEDDLELYVTGRLPEAHAALVEEHLFVCEECRERLAGRDAYVAAVREVPSR